MSEPHAPQERLAAILAGDAVGFSRLMHEDERHTLATLDAYRGVFREAIARHGGRVVDMAGDSILAIFDRATGAVGAALEAQQTLSARNAELPEARRMWFRVGVNLGDILIKDDGTVYGDGVNVAARLQALAGAGGILVSGSVFDSVRARIDAPFEFLGEQTLKHIAAPVPVYRVGAIGEGASVPPPAAARPATGRTRPLVCVMPLKVISGGSEAEALAEGLYHDLVGGLTRQTAIEVVGGVGHAAAAPGAPDVADFQLDGSIRAAGERLRFTFTLLETAARRQIWSERYDRRLDDVFELEDEISRHVASAVRLRIKTGAFEKLRDTPNTQLTVPDLLSKAAGYFVESYAHNDEVAEILRLVLQRQPDSSMAHAMNVFCRYRSLEFSPLAIAEDVRTAMCEESHRAVALEAASYFAQVIDALMLQDLRGDYAAALVHAETALKLNPNFSPAIGMVGVARLHQGDVDGGLRMIQNALDASAEDPHRFRHLRELALGCLLAGDPGRAAVAIDRLSHQAPDLQRNELVAIPVLWHVGRTEEAHQRAAGLRERFPDLDQRTMRPTYVRDRALSEALVAGLTAAGIPG